MFIKRYGQGDRVYFGLHGWSGNHTTFAPMAEHLPRDASLYSVDLPGCGQSPPRELTMPAIAEAIAEAFARVPAESPGEDLITLIGNCSGAIFGLTAMPLIGRYVRRLVLIDPFGYAPWYFRLFGWPRFGRYAYYSTFANPIGRWMANLSLKKHRTGETDLTESFGVVDHAVSLRYLQLMIAIDGISQFAGIRQPIDLVYGERTFGAIRRSLPMWQSIWPQARLHELAGAGHLPIQEATEDLSRIVFM